MGVELKANKGVLTLGGSPINVGVGVEEVYIGDSAPSKEDYKVWINPTGDLPEDVATKGYVDEKFKNIDISDLDIDLTGYATEQYVNDAISTIELTPGPQGEKGEPGADGAPGKDGANGVDGKTPVKGVDYYTAEDKTAIVNDVLAALPAAEEVSV